MKHTWGFRTWLPAAMLLSGLLVTLHGVRPAAAQQSVSVFTVNSTADDSDSFPDTNCETALGMCTLRAALEEANAKANGPGGPDEIRFNIAGSGVQVISPASPLPDIVDPVLINGYTQPGAQPNTLAQGTNAVLLIELKGDSAGSAYGLNFLTSDSTVRGLVINRFGLGGISLLRPNNMLTGNFIGTDPTGLLAPATSVPGLRLVIRRLAMSPAASSVGRRQRRAISCPGIRQRGCGW